ncbi:MAG TPA: Mur ligase domain-containing protein, partial [Opitutaceae bacterium]
MHSFNPKDLAEWTGGSWTGRPAAASGFSVDSRRLSPGHAFVAIRTGRRDGHDFLGAALQAGASFAIVAKHVPGVALA